MRLFRAQAQDMRSVALATLMQIHAHRVRSILESWSFLTFLLVALSSEPKNQMQSVSILDLIALHSAVVVHLLSVEDDSLLIRRNALTGLDGKLQLQPGKVLVPM